VILGLNAHLAFAALMLSACVVGLAAGLLVPPRGAWALLIGAWIAAILVYRFALADPNCHYDCVGNFGWAVVCGSTAFAWTLGLGAARGALALRHRGAT
jgi:hypothetical protein